MIEHIVGATWASGACAQCGSASFVTPLHGDRGGPLFCSMCAGEWNAKQTRIRRAGRVVIGAMKAFMEAGGTNSELNSLKLSAWCEIPVPGYTDSIGAAGELTAEILADALQLVHPDRHPPERQDAARRVTQELLALKPYTFPALPPPPAPPPQERDASSKEHRDTLDEALRRAAQYPCRDCAGASPYYYCTACRAEWDKRHEAECERDRARQRRWYARRKARLAIGRQSCGGCGGSFEPKRRDAKYCSPACRQREHRKRVTDAAKVAGAPVRSRNAQEPALLAGAP